MQCTICVCVSCSIMSNFCDSMDYGPPGSPVHGILQARILEWIAISFSRDLPDPGIDPRFPALQVDSLPSEPLSRKWLPTPIFLGFPSGSDGKESTCNAGDLGLVPGLGRSTGRGHSNPLQYSCLENPYGQRSLPGTVHGDAKSQTRLSD